MIVDHVVVGVFSENSWIVVCEQTGAAVLVDPGDEPESIAAMVEKHGAEPVRIINTHGHLDHVGAVADLRDRYGIPFAIHAGERENIEQMVRHAAFFGLQAPAIPEVDEWVEDGDVYDFGRSSLTAMATPGHTAGGVCFRGDTFVLVGDTLFQGSIGRTDLPGGDFATLATSIRDRLFTLPPETVVHAGHGPDTGIGHEKATNPFVGDAADLSTFGS